MKTDINGFARAAGVSTTTVSNYSNATETILISAEKQTRIRAAMRLAHYCPNSASSLLRRKRELPRVGVLAFGNGIYHAGNDWHGWNACLDSDPRTRFGGIDLLEPETLLRLWLARNQRPEQP